ncbi:MAG: lysophospholipid acyltransferase family protein [Ruminococcus callidus]
MPYPIVFFFYRIAYYLVRIAFFFYYRISFEGRENVPKGTAVIFASNHRSYLDPVLVAMAAPHPFNFIAKEPCSGTPFSAVLSVHGSLSHRRCQAPRL